MVRHGIRCIADSETGLADPYGMLSVFAEPRCPGTETGIKPTHFFKDCSLEGYIASRKTADFTHCVAVVDDGDVIFTQPTRICWAPLGIHPRENPALNRTKFTHTITFPMCNHPPMVHHDIVIHNNQNFSPGPANTLVQCTRFSFGFFLCSPKIKPTLSCLLSQKNFLSIVRRAIINNDYFRSDRIRQ